MTTATSSAAEIAAAVRSGRISAAEIVGDALSRVDRLDKQINAFTAIMREEAWRQAARVDAQLKSGADPGQLAGVPFAVKDLYDVAGHVTRSGARIHAERPPATRSASVVQRLQKDGAIVLGHLNMEEYAYGFFTDNAHFGRTLNPHDLTRTAGGSSGGSAAAVAAGLLPFRSAPTRTARSASRCVLRHLRPQAHVRPSEPGRHDAVRLELRSRRTVRAHGRRSRRRLRRNAGL